MNSTSRDNSPRQAADRPPPWLAGARAVGLRWVRDSPAAARRSRDWPCCPTGGFLPPEIYTVWIDHRDRIAAWDGTTWGPLGSGLNAPAASLATDETDLFVAGDFTTAGGISSQRVARWRLPQNLRLDAVALTNATQVALSIRGELGTQFAVENLGQSLAVAGPLDEQPGCEPCSTARVHERPTTVLPPATYSLTSGWAARSHLNQDPRARDSTRSSLDTESSLNTRWRPASGDAKLFHGFCS